MGSLWQSKLASPDTQKRADQQKYPMTILNVLDLLLVAFCSLTLMLVFIWPCSEGARGMSTTLFHSPANEFRGGDIRYRPTSYPKCRPIPQTR